jgi:glycine/D-amino acid oxidase-like deaminating enzyme
MSSRIVVVGCGEFGVSAALALVRRGHRVRLLESGGIPNNLAASTDISKIVRIAYGRDPLFLDLAGRAREAWFEWNEHCRYDLKPELYHETGALMICRRPMAAGSFEHDCFEEISTRGHEPRLADRYPAWEDTPFADGFFDPRAGYAESAAAVWATAGQAKRLGVEILGGRPVERLLENGGRVTGVVERSGEEHPADAVLLAGGSWTRELLPELDNALRRSYQPVWYLRPSEPDLFRPHAFPVFTDGLEFPAFANADQAGGYYGFPIHPVHAVVKIGHHGPGVEPDEGSLEVPEAETVRLRDYLARNLPSLADAEILQTHLCPYCVTPDEHFLIARHPNRPGLTVASGGSGHAFKFMPVLGDLIADEIEGRPHELSSRAGWRW